MKAKSIFCLAILFSFIIVSHTWAAEWIRFEASPSEDMYYDKSGINNENKNSVRVWVRSIFREKGKIHIYSILKNYGTPPDNPDTVSHSMTLYELDCVNNKFRFASYTIYGGERSVLYSNLKPLEWVYIMPETVPDALKNIVCSDSISK
jgi:hypothetical protein